MEPKLTLHQQFAQNKMSLIKQFKDKVDDLYITAVCAPCDDGTYKPIDEMSNEEASKEEDRLFGIISEIADIAQYINTFGKMPL